MLENKVNGKIYIGQTTRSIYIRLQEHETGKNNRCRLIYRAIKKYGWDNFEKDYYECPDEDLNFDEDLMVREMGTLSPGGYNLREGGGGNGKLSEETKRRIGEAQRGKPKSEESKQKNREANSGERSGRYGKLHTEESKQKMSEATSGEKNYASKRVYKYDLDGTFIESFGSTEEASRQLKIAGSLIRRCARGKRKTSHGFKWSYDMDVFM